MNILLVEDNPGDVRLTQEALRESNMQHHMDVVSDGEMAVKYLLNEGPFEEAPKPDIIFLDLNLPRKDGREALSIIKKNPRTRMIPVIILTTSEAEPDILQSYRLHANCYITKPVDINHFIQVFKRIEQFWFKTVALPTHVN